MNRDIQAALDAEMVNRIEEFRRQRDIRFFRDAVKEYIHHLEKSVAAATL